MTNIRDWGQFHAAAWDWTPLNTCFPGTRIRVMDLDGLVERRGQFLILEGKRLAAGERPGPLPQGQQLTHNALCALGVFTIIVFWGVPPMDAAPPMQLRWVRFLRVQDASGLGWVREATEADLLRAVAAWFEKANATEARVPVVMR